jgi:Tol biopolymer transport system component
MLVKERSRRYQNLFDLRNDLEDFKRDTEQGSLDEIAKPKTGAGRGASWFLGLIALVSAVTLMALTYLWFGRGSEPRINRMSRMIHSQGVSEWPTWSPDGNLIAFASNREGNFEIYVRQVDGGQEVNVTNHPDEDIQPALSPDGQWLAFISLRSSRTGMIRIADTFSSEFRSYGGDLWLMPVLGGQARRLAEDANYPAWHPDGETLAYVSGPEGHRSILRVDVDGGTPEPILPADTSEWEIVRLQFSPNGEWITFETFDDRLNVISARGGEVTELLHASSHVWAPSGDRILFLSTETSGSIRVQDIGFDAGRGTTEGTARTLGLLTGLFTDLSVSADGTQLALTEMVSSLNLTRMPLDSEGKQSSSGIEEMLNAGQVVDHFPVVSPDGSYIAYQSNRLGRQDIWLLDLESRRQERLELPGDDIGVSQPYWSPDGEVLSIIRLHEDGTRSTWLVAVDGSLAEEVVPPMAFLAFGEFSPDGKKLVIVSRQEEFLRQIYIVDLDTRELQQLTFSQSDKFDAVWSIDGQSIVAVVGSGMGRQVVRVTLDGEEKVLASSVERLLHLDISPDGRWIYVQPSHRNIHRIPAAGGELEPVTFFPPSGLYIDEASISPEGDYLVYTRLNTSSAIWVMEVGSGVKS